MSEEADRQAERTAFIGIAVIVLLGSVFAFLGSRGGETTGPLPTFALLVIVAFAINIAAFVPSFISRTDHYYDLTGSIAYLTVTTIAFVTTNTYDARTVLAAVFIYIWAGRLGTFLYKRVKQSDGDRRFDRIKHSVPRFLMAWMLQGLWGHPYRGRSSRRNDIGIKDRLRHPRRHWLLRVDVRLCDREGRRRPENCLQE